MTLVMQKQTRNGPVSHFLNGRNALYFNREMRVQPSPDDHLCHPELARIGQETRPECKSKA